MCANWFSVLLHLSLSANGVTSRCRKEINTAKINLNDLLDCKTRGNNNSNGLFGMTAKAELIQ